MQHLKSRNYRKFLLFIGISILAIFLNLGISFLSNFLPTVTNVNIASAQSVPTMPTYTVFCQRTPNNPVEEDSAPVEVGVKFFSDVDGQISAIRFYRGVANDSGYVAHLWSADGVLLGQGIVIEGQQPTPGWQTVQLYPPVSIQAGTTYVASYYSSRGGYAQDPGYLKTAINISPLHIPADSPDNPNGVFVYGLGGGFPTQRYESSNYFVDVVFSTTVTTSAF